MRCERLVFTARGACEVEAVELDENIGPQEVMIRNRLGLISPGTELAIFTGEHRGFEREDHWAGYPWWPGYSSIGEVIAAGPRSGFAAGDRVVHEGTHGTHARQHATMVVKVPDALSDERAVFFKLLGIAFTPHLVSPVATGEHVAVVGLGMVGNLAAQLCREAGAWDVVGVDLAAGRRAKARACGITAIDTLMDVGTHESARSRAERRPHDDYLLSLLEHARVHVHPFVTHTMPFGAGLQDAYIGLRDDPDHFMGVLIEY